MEEIFNELINFAIKKNATDIHLEAKKRESCQVSMRVKGKVTQLFEYDSKEAAKLINYIIYRANLDIVDNQTIHTGMIRYQQGEKNIFLRVSVLFAQYSKGIVIRILNNHQAISLTNLSLINNNLAQLKKIITFNNGLVIFTGKTGAGKTTTLYAIIDEIKKNSNKKIISIEEPIEREIKDILQISINSDVITYFDVLKQVLRHDPDIIVIGEIRDERDLKLAVQAALSGHLVLTSMHSINALFAVNRLQELKISPSDLRACVKLIAYQELCYSKTLQPFCLYEFIDNQQLNNYLNNQQLNYHQINDYKKVLRKELDFYESKWRTYFKSDC